MRILLVDDSPAMRSFIRRVMKVAGLGDGDYFEAGNGAEALEMIEAQGGADLVLCDVNMPVMDGEAFVEELHRRGALDHTTVLMVSTDSTHTRMNRIMELGAKGYLQKPFTPERLKQAVSDCVGGPH